MCAHGRRSSAVHLSECDGGGATQIKTRASRVRACLARMTTHACGIAWHDHGALGSGGAPGTDLVDDLDHKAVAGAQRDVRRGRQDGRLLLHAQRVHGRQQRQPRGGGRRVEALRRGHGGHAGARVRGARARRGRGRRRLAGGRLRRGRRGRGRAVWRRAALPSQLA